mgnify:CR=1 FL=1
MSLPFPFNYMIKAVSNHGHVSLILYGRRGVGKSRTALFLAYSIMYYNNHKKLPKEKHEFEDWDLWSRIIRYRFIYHPEQLIKRLENRKERLSVLVIDDANIMFNSFLYRDNPKLYLSLIGVFATIRTEVANLIVTCVDPEELIKPIRQMQSWFGAVYSVKKQIHVRVQELIQSPVKPYLKTIGYFSWDSKLLPYRVYHDYLIFRKALSKKAIETAKDILLKSSKEENSKAE